MADEQILDQISKEVQRLSGGLQSVRMTAVRHNGNVNKIVKDLGDAIKSHDRDGVELFGEVDGIKGQIGGINQQIETFAEGIRQVNDTQSGILSRLDGMDRSIKDLYSSMSMLQQNMNNMGGGGYGAGDAAMDAAGNMGGKRKAPSSKLLKMLGFGAAAVGTGAAVYGASQMMDGEENATPQEGGGGTPQVASILAAIRHQESGSAEGNYQAKNPKSSASGAYQFTDATWSDAAKHAKIGTDYKRAMDAPKAIQDKVAEDRVNYLLKKVNGDVNQIPVMWHGGESRADASRVNEADEQYRQQWTQKYEQQVAQQPQNEPQPTSSSGTSEDYAAFLKSRSQGGVDAERLDKQFAERLTKAIQAAEEATKEKILITSAYRSAEKQAQLYANYIRQPYNYEGKIYTPNGPPPPMAAKPGKSAHETGHAVDISRGKALEWLKANAAKFGLKDLAGDPPHISDAGTPEQPAVSPSGDGASPRAKTPEMAEAGGETSMRGLFALDPNDPKNKPAPVGMGDMDSYNPKAILASMMGGDMLGPSGQMGAVGAAVGIGAKAADELFGSEKITPKTTPEPIAQQPQQIQQPQQMQEQPPEPPKIDDDAYNHPDDRDIMSSWRDRVLDIFSNETSAVTQTW